MLDKYSSLEEVFPTIPKTLLLKDGIHPLFYILKSVLSDSSSSNFVIAQETMKHIELLVKSEPYPDSKEIISIIFPFLLECMKSENIDHKKHAAWAIAILAKNGIDVRKALPPVISWLSSRNLILLQHATWILRNLTRSGFDTSSAVPALDKLLENEDYTVRNYAAQSISNEYLRSSTETKIVLFSELSEHERLDSYWSVDVHHRRHHALTDIALSIPQFCKIDYTLLMPHQPQDLHHLLLEK